MDREVFDAIEKEKIRQNTTVELIASENFVSDDVLRATGSVLTNKYAEGYPDKRYYGGCHFVDEIEKIAIDRVKKLFRADHANVQPHSGSQANMAVYMSVLKPNDLIMGMDLSNGGHLTHGASVSFSGKLFRSISYGIDPKTERLNYTKIEELAVQNKPKIIVAGASAYPRMIDFKAFSDIAKKVGAYLLVDIAHIAGLVATGLHQSPVEYADFVTSTTHKTLRGPRGGFILCKEKYAKDIDKAIFPCIQGGPLEHVIAAKGVAFGEALKPKFKTYINQVVKNTKVLAEELMKYDFDLVTSGTDNHLMLVKLNKHGITGREAEVSLENVGITVNRNAIPNDPQPLNLTSGIRVGTAAVTTRGLRENEMKEIARIIAGVLKNLGDNKTMAKEKENVKRICAKYTFKY